MRVDKFIANLGYGTRKEVAKFFKDGLIEINSVIAQKGDEKIKFGDKILIGEEEIEYKEFLYVILNKPDGYLSSRELDGKHPSFLELLQDFPYANLLQVAGRLDVDTQGLLLLSNNGDFIHKIISPKKEILKKYFVISENKISEKDISKLQNGVKIDEEYITKPAIFEKISGKENEFYLSISEGKFHQIKKMLEAIGNKVLFLKRISIGEFELGNLEVGKWKEIFLNDF